MKFFFVWIEIVQVHKFSWNNSLLTAYKTLLWLDFGNPILIHGPKIWENKLFRRFVHFQKLFWREIPNHFQALCESNAKIEGVSDRTTFIKGDACKLPFPDNSFDAITSNYCYHNIPVKDRQAILLENLRVLRKGGSFVIHDLFTTSKYGEMDAFLQQLKEMGFEEVELRNTMDGQLLTRKEAGISLSGSKLLIGKK